MYSKSEEREKRSYTNKADESTNTKGSLLIFSSFFLSLYLSPHPHSFSFSFLFISFFPLCVSNNSDSPHSNCTPGHSQLPTPPQLLSQQGTQKISASRPRGQNKNELNLSFPLVEHFYGGLQTGKNYILGSRIVYDNKLFKGQLHEW